MPPALDVTVYTVQFRTTCCDIDFFALAHPHFSCPPALDMTVYTVQSRTTCCDIDFFALATTYCDIDFLILALYLNSPRSDNPNVFLVVVHDIR
ncbi:hypothetical protein DFH09DRAFT_1326249 [Mycena vulgaris]|nr:hypothetical protein DFH09DRAFT_1326249 [Mycena vulgaris]